MRGASLVLACAALLGGCGYAATVEQRGLKHQPEPLRILNRQVRIFDCADVPAQRESCQYLRFQVALDKPQASLEQVPGVALPKNQPPPTEPGARVIEPAAAAPDSAPVSPNKDQICPNPQHPDNSKLSLAYEVLRYPSSTITKYDGRLRKGDGLPVNALLLQRPFAKTVGLPARWSVDSERVTAANIGDRSGGKPVDLEICEGKLLANLDLVLLDERINKGATGDVYLLEVWPPSDPQRQNSTVERLNTVAQYGLGSAITGVVLMGAYIFFGATR